MRQIQATTRAASGALGLMVGLALGVGLCRLEPPRLEAGGGDRPDASLVTTGPIATEFNRNLSIQVAKDAIYYLNYSRGRLLAALPLEQHTANASRTLSEFAERDLVRDFQLPPGSRPHFTMVTGTLGALSGDGWAPLYVFESTTGLLGVYRVRPQVQAGSSAPQFDLLDLVRDRRLAHAGGTLETP